MDQDRRYGLEDDHALAKAVQRYLQALSQAVALNMRPRTKHNQPLTQVTLMAYSAVWGMCRFLWHARGFSPMSQALGGTRRAWHTQTCPGPL